MVWAFSEALGFTSAIDVGIARASFDAAFISHTRYLLG